MSFLFIKNSKKNSALKESITDIEEFDNALGELLILGGRQLEPIGIEVD